ncbi:retrovirus-related pol polyprotein from transposon TNT 1-94 [Tanacetum coccineum]
MIDTLLTVKLHLTRTPYEISKKRIPDISYFHVFGCPVFIHNHKDHLGKFDAKADDGYFLRYSFNSKAFRVFNARRQQIHETYHVTFDKSIEAIRFTNTSVDEIRINDSSRYPPDEFLQEDDPSRQYQANFDISYYIIPHGRSLNELTQDTHVPEVITSNEQNTPHTEDVKGPPDLVNTEGTQEQNIQDEQINHQLESARDVYSKRRIIAITNLQIVEWHNYKHLDWITVRRDDDKLYKFKEGDLNRLHIQDIEDMLLFLVQGKLINLTVEECLALKLNLTKPDTYRSDLKRREAYTAYSNPRGFVYQNKDKKNRLMRIDELHKFSDGTLNDVRTALDDHLKGIQMKYLPQTIWRM